MTRIALIRQRYNPYGGAERFLERALDGLRREGVVVTLIARAWQSAEPGDWIRCDSAYLGRVWRDAAFAACVRRVLARERFDLVQSHERIPGCEIYRAGDGVHATWLEQRGLTQSRLARLVTGLQPWHRYTLVAEDKMFRHPALRAVICNSRMVRDDIARRFGVPEAKLHVIRNGVDTEVFHPRARAQHRDRVRRDLGLAEAQPVFLHVGSGFERKGVATSLAALAATGNRDSRLLIVGRDKRRAHFERLASKLGLGGRAIFLGGRPDVLPYYGAADAFVLPTLYDPMPNAALEALACGLPAIVSSSCGAAELVGDGKGGFVVEPLDVAGVSRKMDELASLGAAAAMSAAARSSAEPYSVAAMSRQLAHLYDRLLARSGPAAR
jgi:UDP-glucose:(heptosyl)LPS alpha-1,3-glucosyltransferase